MKVIRTDNFNRDTVSDVLVKDSLTASEAHSLAEELNRQCGKYSQDYYMAVADDHKLYVYDPND